MDDDDAVVAEEPAPEDEEKWANSNAKQLLYNDIVSGRVPADMPGRFVRLSRPEYEHWKPSNFTTNLRTLRKTIRKDHVRMVEDVINYGKDVDTLREIRENNPPTEEKPDWDKLGCHRMLQKDLKDWNYPNPSPTKQPRHLQQTRPEYMLFTNKQFNDHIQHEVRRKMKLEYNQRHRKKKLRMRAPPTVPTHALL